MQFEEFCTIFSLMLCKIHKFAIPILSLLIKIYHPNLSMLYSFPACNEVHKSTIGSIKSPNFPRNYPKNANCHYLLMNSDPATRITLSFLRFDLHQFSWTSMCYDYVKIYDGNSTKATQIGRTHGYCGKRAPPTLTIASTRNSLLIVFVSWRWRWSWWLTNSGFHATYRGRIAHIYFI